MSPEDREMLEAAIEREARTLAAVMRRERNLDPNISPEHEQEFKERVSDFVDVLLELFPDYDLRASSMYHKWKAAVAH